MTNQELFRIVSEENVISKEVIDILLELDSTASVTTQASLEELLSALYNRLDEEDISIDDIDAMSRKIPQISDLDIGDHVTKEEFKAWVDDNFDDYSAKIFDEEA